MRLKTLVLLFCGAVALAALVACGSSSSTPTPTTPIPTPLPTPKPTPTPDSSIPPPSSGCGKPYPPPLHGINVRLHVRAPEYFTLDSTALVGPSSEYCRQIGYTDGREFCPVRIEHSEERRACEAWIMGNAEDTGKPGPTWDRDSEYWCTTFEKSGCEHDPDNPFYLRVQVGGKYHACKGEDICGEVQIDR